jgi:hypothetical protein
MQKRGSQFDKGDSNLRPIASVTHGRLRDAGQLEAKVAVIATFLRSASRKRIFFENESKGRLKRGFLGEWDLFRNLSSEQFLMGALEKRSRLNENEGNSRSGLDHMTTEISFERWFTNIY